MHVQSSMKWFCVFIYYLFILQACSFLLYNAEYMSYNKFLRHVHHPVDGREQMWQNKDQIHSPGEGGSYTFIVNLVIFTGGKFRKNVNKTFHVGVNFTMLLFFP